MMNFTNPNDFWRPGDSDPMKGLSDDERMAVGCIHGAAIIVAFILCLLFCAMCSSCTTTKYVTVPEYHTDTLIVTNHQHDSIYAHDSIMVSEKGDTVRIEKWHTKYVMKEVHDTIYKSKTDSVPVPYPVIQEVPAKLSTGHKVLMIIGGLAIFGLVAWLGRKFNNILPGR